MRAIVGLGNPGARYRRTRHNAGWQVLDQLAVRWHGGKPEKARHAEVVRCVVDGEPVLLLKPLTFMNDSGKAVRALIEKDRLAPEEILVIYDDLDLQLGRVRLRAQGSSGGHGGIRSIQQHLAQLARARDRGLWGKELGTRAVGSSPGDTGQHDQNGGQMRAGAPAVREYAVPAFPRLKVGIGRPPAGVDPVDFVLTGFTPDELRLIEPAIERAADAAECWLREGTAAAMNRFNGT
jgi:PTH1 family peptidyl-tRNA hydrolase